MKRTYDGRLCAGIYGPGGLHRTTREPAVSRDRYCRFRRCCRGGEYASAAAEDSADAQDSESLGTLDERIARGSRLRRFH